MTEGALVDLQVYTGFYPDPYISHMSDTYMNCMQGNIHPFSLQIQAKK